MAEKPFSFKLKSHNRPYGQASQEAVKAFLRDAAKLLRDAGAYLAQRGYKILDVQSNPSGEMGMGNVCGRFAYAEDRCVEAVVAQSCIVTPGNPRRDNVEVYARTVDYSVKQKGKNTVIHTGGKYGLNTWLNPNVTSGQLGEKLLAVIRGGQGFELRTVFVTADGAPDYFSGCYAIDPDLVNAGPIPVQTDLFAEVAG